jgi:hypothetical protein
MQSLPKVGGIALKDAKILWTVIQGHAVYMVHNFFRPERSPKNAL